MRAYEGYFENGRFYPAEQTAHIKGRRRAIINILDDEADRPDKNEEQIQIRRRLEAFERFLAENKALDEQGTEPLDDEFFSVINSGVSIRELNL
ncbi:MAG: hypothetical protein FWH10_08205 [Oscillospiraceae bacterium]|nr:hypothetical protein [Oscillospiraceae bacterium]